MKYIFMAGAPGSKWSSVTKNIYFSPSIDRTDATPEREYYHDAPGTLELMHIGAYFDPGMEFGDFFNKIDQYTKAECEREFDRPFSGEGVRIIKSHVFADHIDFLRDSWPDCPVVLVHREDAACLDWWIKCGEFNITYPKYNKYYVDLTRMEFIIKRQNQGILQAWEQYCGTEPTHNHMTAQFLGLLPVPNGYYQEYITSDIKVKVIR